MSFSINTLGYFLNSVIWLGQCLNQYAKNYRVFISIYMYIHFLHLIHLIFLLAHLHWGESSNELFWSHFVCCPSVHTLFTFSTSSPKPRNQSQPNLAQSKFRQTGFKVVKIKVQAPFSWEIIRNYWIFGKFSKIFSRIIQPGNLKLMWKHLQVV